MRRYFHKHFIKQFYTHTRNHNSKSPLEQHYELIAMSIDEFSHHDTKKTSFGIPVSTSHSIVGSIIGVGLTNGVKSISWGTAKSILWAWLLTIPAPMLISGILYSLIFG
mgnify:CR=1 FL=1